MTFRRVKYKFFFEIRAFLVLLALVYVFYPGDYDGECTWNPTSNWRKCKLFSGSYLNIITRVMKRKENIHLLCIATKLDANSNVKDKFHVFTKSVLEKASVPIVLSVITDKFSRSIVEGIISDAQSGTRFHEVTYFDVPVIEEKLKQIFAIMSPHFSTEPGNYFTDPLFYLSLGLHYVLESDQDKVIVADVDMKFNADIAELWREFYAFNINAIIGIAPELAPTYRHFFGPYRASNPATVIGEPLSENGFPGFNSGILLLNLERIRRSRIFAKFIGDDIIGNPKGTEEIKKLKEEVNGRVTSVDELVKKYSFKGVLGDQDFYTLLGVEYPELIHIIPCVWNRQLCTYWVNRDGFGPLFDKYFKCNGTVKIYHGNCNSTFPNNVN